MRKSADSISDPRFLAHVGLENEEKLMNYQIVKSIIAALALTAVSGCLSSAPGANGNGEVAAAYRPVDGMNYQAASQVGIVEGQAKRFAFTNGGSSANLNQTTGGSIQFNDGSEQENGNPDHNQGVVTTFDIKSPDGKTTTQTTRTQYNEFYNMNETALSVRNVNVGGESMVRAQSAVRNRETGEVIRNNDFLYIPGSGENANVAMTGQLDGTNTSVGIFGDRTTSSQLAATTGSASYSGVSHGYASNTGSFENTQDGEYVGNVNMNVNFANGAYNSNSTMSNVDGAGTVTFAHSGTINANGGMQVNSTTINGADAVNSTISGGLFGSNAESAGYAFDITGDVGEGYISPLSISGGAILN